MGLDNFDDVTLTGNKTKTAQTLADNIKDNILTYVKTRLYDRSNNKSSSETLKRDQELLRKFSDDFKLDFERYVSENNQIIDFDQILTSIQNETEELNSKKTINKIISEVSTILIQNLKQEIVRKIKAEVLSSIKISDIQKQIESLQKYQISNQDAKNTIQRAFQDNDFIQNLDLKYGDQQREKYRDRIIDYYKKTILDPLDASRYLQEKEKNKKIPNYIPNIFKNIKNLNDNTAKIYSTILIDRIMFLINLSMAEKMSKIISNALKFVISIPGKIIRCAIKSLKSVISTLLVPSLIGTVLKFVVSPIIWSISKSIGFVSGLLKTVTSNLKKVIKRVAISKLLLTPQGMYAIGFLVGFIWKKIKNLLLPFDDNDLSVFDIIKSIYSEVIEGYGIIKKTIDEWLEDHPTINSVIKGAISDISTLFEALVTGNYKLLSTTNIAIGIQHVESMIKGIYNSAWFAPIKLTVNLLKSIGEFIIEHPKISSMLYGLSEFFWGLRSITNLVWPIRGNFFKGLAGSLISYGIGEGINAFSSMFGMRDEDSMSYLRTRQSRMYDRISEHYSENVQNKLGRLKYTDRDVYKRYTYLIEYCEHERNTISKLARYFDIIQKYFNNFNGDENRKKVWNGLVDRIPRMTSALLDSKFFDDDYIKTKYEDIQKNKYNTNYVLSKFSEILTHRTDSVANIYDYINNLNEENFSSGLDKMIDKDLKIKTFNSKDGLNGFSVYDYKQYQKEINDRRRNYKSSHRRRQDIDFKRKEFYKITDEELFKSPSNPRDRRQQKLHDHYIKYMRWNKEFNSSLETIDNKPKLDENIYRQMSTFGPSGWTKDHIEKIVAHATSDQIRELNAIVQSDNKDTIADELTKMLEDIQNQIYDRKNEEARTQIKELKNVISKVEQTVETQREANDKIISDFMKEHKSDTKLINSFKYAIGSKRFNNLTGVR